MISKFSVKKPYTVIVAVVLVIILGVVSFTKMSTDLLPSMDLPYAIVMTTYPGASPETVEQTVTKPIEQSMATVSNIKNVSSMSSENASVVILEFGESTNMDSVTLEMRENLDQIKGYWDDSVGNPIIMKLNPDMMPVLVAAADVDGMSAAEVTDYIENNVQSELESIDGVARISVSGNVTESIQVQISQEKLDAVNQKVQDAINGQFEEKEQDLADAQEELNSNKAKLEDGKQELEAGQNEAASQIGEGSAKLNEAQSELTKNAAEVDVQLQNLESKQAELDTQKQLLEKTEALLNQTIEQLTEAKGQLSEAESGQSQLEDAISKIDAQIENLQGQLDALEKKPDGMTEEQWKKSIETVQNGLETAQAQKEQLTAQLEQLNAQMENLQPESIDTGIEAANQGLKEIAEAKVQLASGQEQLDAGKEMLTSAKEQIEAGKSQMTSAQIELEAQKILGSVQLSTAANKIEMGSVQLETAQAQLDSGKEQLSEAKEQAQEKSDLNQILTSDMIKGILTAENFSMPAGYVTEDGSDYLVRVGDKLQDVDSLGDLVIMDLGIDGLKSITLSDVADINVEDDSSEVYAKINGNPGVMLSIEKQTGYSTGDVTDKILNRMEELEASNDGLHFTTLMNQGIYIDLVVNSVMENMIYGGILAILILFLFLRDIKPTFVIACSIPISVVAAIVMMYFSGVTLNIISLSGLALGVGMLVDNSIVVIENIYRMRALGVPARKAAIEGASQVAGAIAASTLTTVCVFAPIVFTEGITRQLFVDMGLTIAYSLLASLIVALTLVPMMSAGILRKGEAKQVKSIGKIQDLYEKLVLKALKHKVWVLIAALVLFFGSMYLSIQKGTEFFPDMESTQATLTVTTDSGTPLEETAEKSDEVIQKIEDIEDIETIGAMAGGSSISLSGSSSTNQVTMYLVLKEDRKLSSAGLEKEIKNRTKGIEDCEINISTSSMDMSALGSSGINIRIKGKELDTLQEISADLARQVEKVKGTQNVSDGLQDSDPQYKIIVDKAKAMRNNLTVAQVFQKINARLAEASSATTISTATKDYDVYVTSEADEDLTREALSEITIETTDASGETKEIKVGDIATFEDAQSPQTITRDAQSRYMSVSAEIATGYNIGLVSQDVQRVLDKYELPDGYTVEMTGEDETINNAMSQLMLMLALALVFMYLIMVAQFQSVLSPFIIMFTIPLAFTGGFIGLILTNKPISVVAMIGFVMLSGIIVNNGIVLVDYINQLRKEGMEKQKAIAEAGRSRLRPIIMTALTTILGLVTMAMGVGMGSDMMQPMAIVTIGGLIYGTLLTLFVVPCVYDILNRRNYKKDEERLADGEANFE